MGIRLGVGQQRFGGKQRVSGGRNHLSPDTSADNSGERFPLPTPPAWRERISLTFGTKYNARTYYNRYRILISGTDPGVPRVLASRRSISESLSLHVGAKGVPFRTNGGLIATSKKGQTFNQVGHGSGAGLVGTRRHMRLAGGSNVAYRGYPRFGEFFSRTRYSKNSYLVKPGYRRFRYGSIRSYGFGSRHPSTGRIHGIRDTQITAYSPASYSHQFALFRFDVGSQTDYGWLELSLRNGFDTGLIVDIFGYAYDISGKPIPAGAVPEPKQLPLTLAALALGAIGVRELRAKRRAAA